MQVIGMVTDIAAARKRLGVTIQQVAARAGLASSTVSRIEQGKRRGRTQTLQRIVTALEAIAFDTDRARARLASLGKPETERKVA